MVYFISLSAIIIVILAGALWAYYRTFYNNLKNTDIHLPPVGKEYEPFNHITTKLMEEMDAIQGENVTVISYDRKKLSAIYYHVQDGAPLHIQFHGYKGNYLRDFCGGNKLARKLGHNTLVIHQRAHVASDGRTITFGIKERYDCLTWIKYANERFGNTTPIFLSGISMGAATVLMASDLDLPKNVIGIIADCPYSSPKEIIKKVAADIGYPSNILFPVIWLGAFLFGHFNILSSSAVKSVKNTSVPILLIHGENDKFVPCEMSQKIYESNPNIIRFVTIPEAAHGLSYMIDSETYNEEAQKFIFSALDKYKRG